MTDAGGATSADPFLPKEMLGAPTLAPAEIAAALTVGLTDLGTRIECGWVPLQPIVLAPPAMRALAEGAETLVRLCARAVIAAAPTWRARAAALDVPEHLLPLLTPDEENERALCDIMARADATLDLSGPRFLELNVSGAFGGPPEVRALDRVWRTVYPATAQWSTAGRDPLRAQAEVVRRLMSRDPVKPRVAVVGSVRDHAGADTPRFFQMQADELGALGIAATVVTETELDRLTEHGRPAYDAVLASYTAYEWHERGLSFRGLRSYMDLGGLVFPTQAASLLGNKRVFAWLSEERLDLSDAERAFVRAAVPWTRALGGSRPDPGLRRHCLSEQHGLVLKKEVSMKSAHVVVGRYTARERWRAAVERATGSGGWIVQEFVAPATCTIAMFDPRRQVEAARSVRLVLAPCLFDGRDSGCYVRYSTRRQPAVVSAGSPGGMENVAITPVDPIPTPDGSR